METELWWYFGKYTHIWETHGQREVTPLILILKFFFSPQFFSPSQSHSTAFFFFFPLHKLTPTAIFFLLLHKNTWVTLSKKKRKKKHMGIDFQTQKIKPINTWYWSYTLTQTHKHVHPHNKSKNFFSKHKQNPEVRNEREERGVEEGWNQSCMSLI